MLNHHSIVLLRWRVGIQIGSIGIGLQQELQTTNGEILVLIEEQLTEIGGKDVAEHRRHPEPIFHSVVAFLQIDNRVLIPGVASLGIRSRRVDRKQDQDSPEG